MNPNTPSPSTRSRSRSRSRTRHRYTDQFKSELVTACLAPGASISAIAAANGMHSSILHRWLQTHHQSSTHAPSTPPASGQTSSAGFIALDLSALRAAPSACAAQTIEQPTGRHLGVGGLATVWRC